MQSVIDAMDILRVGFSNSSEKKNRRTANVVAMLDMYLDNGTGKTGLNRQATMRKSVIHRYRRIFAV
jgi:hypothetical protein